MLLKVQESSNSQLSRLEELKRRMESLNPSRSSNTNFPTVRFMCTFVLEYSPWSIHLHLGCLILVLLFSPSWFIYSSSVVPASGTNRTYFPKPSYPIRCHIFWSWNVNFRHSYLFVPFVHTYHICWYLMLHSFWGIEL